MSNLNLNRKSLNRGLILFGIFGFIPMLFYWVGIRPAMQRMQQFQQQISSTELGQPHSYFRITPAISAEQAAISGVQAQLLTRVPIVRDAEDLIRYGAVLSSALASEAAALGIRVSGVEALNGLVKGHYLPAHNASSTELANWPRASGSVADERLRILSLDMPSLELQMTMTGDYSKVFTFVESLAGFPTLVDVNGVSVESDGLKASFHLKIRGFYSSAGKRANEGETAKPRALTLHQGKSLMVGANKGRTV